MTVDHWFSLALLVLNLTVGAFVFFWRRDRDQDAEAQRLRIETLERTLGYQIEGLRHELREYEQTTTLRFDQASHESSKLASLVQAVIGRLDRMPDDLRAKFLALDVWRIFHENDKKKGPHDE